jgi:DNA-directed RNA polymerase subunit omega
MGLNSRLPDHESPLLSVPLPPGHPGKNVPSPYLLPMKAELVEQAALIIKDPPILINMVSKRVKQLNSGRSPLVERRPGLREADIALMEIIQGKIKIADVTDEA